MNGTVSKSAVAATGPPPNLRSVSQIATRHNSLAAIECPGMSALFSVDPRCSVDEL